MDRPEVLFGEPLPLGDDARVLEVERHALFGCEPDAQRALRAIDARIHHGVELELDAELVGEPLLNIGFRRVLPANSPSGCSAKSVCHSSRLRARRGGPVRGHPHGKLAS